MTVVGGGLSRLIWHCRVLVFFKTMLICLGAQVVYAQLASKSWKDVLPADVQTSLLWYADHEEGTLFDWEYKQNPNNNGGGVFNTGEAKDAFAQVDQKVPLTGKFCVKTVIHNALESRNGKRAVRLMRWTDKPWDQGGKFLPEKTYFGVWMRMDENYSLHNPRSPSGGWWNLFQFKSNDDKGASQPVWVVNIGNDRQSGKMQFYLYSKHNKPNSVSQVKPIPIPVGRWFHVEALYEQSNENKGSITIWQDGQMILAAKEVKTILKGNVIWGIGNYTDHVTGGAKAGSATVYFDDATISTKPTHGYVKEILDRKK